MTLIEFLRKHLDEEERVAEEMALIEGSSWSVNPSSSEGTWEIANSQREAVVHSDDDCCLGRDVAEWIAANDPKRRLDEVKAKRAVLALHQVSHECSVLDERGDNDRCRWVPDGEDCTTVLLLAQPLARREGWQPEWSVAL